MANTAKHQPQSAEDPLATMVTVENAAENGAVSDTGVALDSRQLLDKPQPSLPDRLTERSCLVILAGLAVFYTLYFARAILLPMTLAVLLNLVLTPLTKWLKRRGIPHVLSAAMIFIVTSAVVLSGATMLSGPLNNWLNEAPKSLKEVGRKLRSHAGPLAKIKEAKKEIDEITSTSVGDEKATSQSDEKAKQPVAVRIEQPALAWQMMNSTGGFMTSATIVLVLLFFLLAAGDRFMEKTVEVIPTWRGKRDVVALFREIQHQISTYLGLITLINIGLGVVIGLGLWLIDMPNPALWGVLAALLNFIPFAGLVIGALTVFAVALTTFPTLGHALLAPLVYLGANGVEANLVTPAVLGKSISLNPVVILLAVFLGGWIWGIGGIFLAVPVLLVLKIACDNNDSLKPVGVFLGR